MSPSGAVFLQQGLGQLTIVESTMNYLLYQRALEENVRPSVRKLKLKGMWTMQHDNDSNMTVNAPRNGSKERSGEFWNGQVEA